VKKAFTFCIICLLGKTIQAQDSLFQNKKDTIKVSAPAYYVKRSENSKKKFRWNLIPGINLFLLTARGTALDLNPYVTKQFSTHWSLGLGWNQRISLNRSRYRGNYTSQLFGPRLMITYHWKHGFSFRAIPEAMHIRLPRNLYPTSRYQWDWSLFGGVRKDFNISKNTKGYVELLYDIASTSIQPLYGDKVNLRIGFEFGKLFRKKSQD
jgi:hypothetical protein